MPKCALRFIFHVKENLIGVDPKRAARCDNARTRCFPACLWKERRRHRAHGVVVSHPLRMRKALGSIPSVSMFDIALGEVAALRAMLSQGHSSSASQGDRVEFDQGHMV